MSIRAKISPGGKISIPSVYRKQLDLKDGEEILIDIQEGNIVITSLKTSLLKARRLVDQYHSTEESLVEKLFTIRKEENDE